LLVRWFITSTAEGFTDDDSERIWKETSVVDICMMELSKTWETAASKLGTPTNIQPGYLHCNSLAITFGRLVEHFTQD